MQKSRKAVPSRERLGAKEERQGGAGRRGESVLGKGQYQREPEPELGGPRGWEVARQQDQAVEMAHSGRQVFWPLALPYGSNTHQLCDWREGAHLSEPRSL